MKEIGIIVLIMFGILWYSETGHRAVIDDNEEVLTPLEVKEFYERGVLKNPDYSNTYFTTRKVTYMISRSKVPLLFNRDTITVVGLRYWSRDKNN